MDDGDTSRHRPMRPLDPLLLGSFPAPPTHIPPTPTSPNPPPSRPPSSPLPPLPARAHHRPNDSISSIDVRDILEAAAISDDEASADDGKLAALPPLARNPPLRPRNPTHALSLADPIDPQTTMPIARSFTYPAASSPRRTIFSPPSPPPPRPSSPDIAAIISATPRPRANSLHRSKHKAVTPRRASEGLPYVVSSPYGVYRHSRGAVHDAPASDDDDTRSWIDHDEFGRPLPPPPKPAPYWSAEEESRFAELERHLDGSDSDASDSSLDIHTPLPHLMMRHGLLSPQSRLITQSSARDSVVSLASSTTTSKSTHPLKDARDTVKRRVRHRDGRLLRGGIGLTTGLGWSDSEDEGAPSALTRRISSLNLTSRPSLALSTSALSEAPSRSSTSSSASLPSRKSSASKSLRGSEYNADEFGRATRERIPEGEETEMEVDSPGGNIRTSMSVDTFSRYTHRPPMTIADLEGGARSLKREKSLPPLPPRSSLGSVRSMGAIAMARRDSGASNTPGSPSLGRPALAPVRATITKAAASSSPVGTTPPYAKSTPDSGAAGTVRTPRPLRLTTHLAPPNDRPPVPVPGVGSPPSTPSPVTPGRPRVGTGMVYRSAGSRMRVRASTTAATGGMQKPIIPL